jgi:hypothetical protein
MSSSDFRSALCHFAGSPLIDVAFTGHRGAAARGHHAGAETDLSCSVVGCVVVPLPIRRRVRERCTSKFFAPSMAFTARGSGSAPAGSLLMQGQALDAAGFLIVRTDYLLALQEDIVVALRQRGLPRRRPPATGLLGHYPDRTHTGESTTAFRTHPLAACPGRTSTGWSPALPGRYGTTANVDTCQSSASQCSSPSYLGTESLDARSAAWFAWG